MLDIKDIYWLAGILEGEGCFSWQPHNSVLDIRLCMTDKDIVYRAANLIGRGSIRSYQPQKGKTQWRWTLTGSAAAGLMMTILPIVGERRRHRLIEILNAWKLVPARPRRSLQRKVFNLNDEVAHSVHHTLNVDVG